MDKKSLVIVGIILFLLLTIIAMSMDVSQRKKVSFINQSLSLNNENANIENKRANVNTAKSKISTNNTGVNIQGANVKSTSTDIAFESLDNQKTGYSNQQLKNDSQGNYYNSFDDFKNRKQRLENARSQINNASPRLNNQNVSRYIVKNIDWSTWKSQFINKILDDSVYITSLDDYGVGAWFYYSFIVTSDGAIKDLTVRSPYISDIDWSTWKSQFINKILDDSVYITSLDDYGVGAWFYYSFIVTSDGAIKDLTVRSPYISDIDKQRVMNLIKSYEYTDITVFPANSRRVTAKVDAVVMLGNSEKKSKPSDFNDVERIKMSLP